MIEVRRRFGGAPIPHPVGVDGSLATPVHSPKPLSIAQAAGLLVALGTDPASAERWRLEPSASLQLGYDDNPQLLSVDAEGSFLTTLNASLRGTRSTEVSDLGVAIGFAGNRYSDAPDLDNTSGYAGMDLGYRLERHRFGLSLRYITQSTLYSQQPPSQLNQVNQQQDTVSVNPSWGYILSERTTLDLAASFHDVSYEDAGLVRTSDYRVGSVNLGVGHNLTERFALTGSLGYERYETQDITNEYDNVRFLAGGSHQLSEISSLAAQAGIRSTEQTREEPLDGRTLTKDSLGPTFSLSYFRQFEAGGGLSLQARRDLAPTGSGEVVDSTGLLASLSIRLRPQWQLGITASAFRSRSPSGDAVRGDETSYSIGPRLSYRIVESWGLSIGHLYRSQGFGDLGDDAVSNAVYLNLSWAGPRDL